MKKKWKWILAFILAVFCAIAGVVYYLRPVNVSAEAAVRGDLIDSFTEQGTIQPEESTLLSANTTGFVTGLPPRAGVSVKQGEEIVTIDDSLLRKQMEDQVASLKLQQSALYAQGGLNQADISLRQEQLRQQLETAQRQYDQLYGQAGTARAQLSIARSNYSSARRAYLDAKSYYDDVEDGSYTPGQSDLIPLYSAMNIAEKGLMLAQNDNTAETRAYYESMIQSCKAQLAALLGSGGSAAGSTSAAAEQLQIAIDDLESKLARKPVSAPFDGVVWEVLAEDGAFVSENQPVARIYRPSGMHIEAELLSEDALGLSEDMSVEGRLTDGTAFTASVKFVSPVAQETLSAVGVKENRCPVELIPDNLPAGAGAGHQADLTFSVVRVRDVISIPTAALVPLSDGSSSHVSGVYLLQNGRTVLTPVETGVQCGGRTEIRSGVSKGDLVASNPYDDKLKNGMRVTQAS